MSKSERAWLITHHAPQQIVTGYASIAPQDVIVAVDGGFQRCLELRLKPSVLIGDFDSLAPSLLDKVPTDCKKITYSSHKNETDSQLAIQYCLEHEINDIIICNSLEGRFDHSYALIQNLLQIYHSGAQALIASATQLVFILCGNNTLDYPPATEISLLSLSEKAELLSSQGLQYPLEGLTLRNWLTRGISNHVTERPQQINIASGLVLAVVTPPTKS